MRKRGEEAQAMSRQTGALSPTQLAQKETSQNAGRLTAPWPSRGEPRAESAGWERQERRARRARLHPGKPNVSSQSCPKMCDALW